MDNIVGSVKVIVNEQLRSSSSFAKNGMLLFNGRSASFFRISTGYSMNP